MSGSHVRASTYVSIGVCVSATTVQSVIASMHLQFGNRPPEYVLIFGGVGSLLVALVYVPPWAALRQRGYRLCDELFPMRDLDNPQAILSLAGDLPLLEQNPWPRP